MTLWSFPNDRCGPVQAGANPQQRPHHDSLLQPPGGIKLIGVDLSTGITLLNQMMLRVVAERRARLIRRLDRTEIACAIVCHRRDPPGMVARFPFAAPCAIIGKVVP